MYPMFQLWAANFTQLYPNIQINTANTGTGTGQSFVAKGLVQIGGSAAFLTDDQKAQPLYQNIMNIPLAVTADIIEYNLPEVPLTTHLKFTATLLTQIYNFNVKYWDDAKIKAVNPEAASLLPHQAIWPTVRSDASGDTWLFTQYLVRGDPFWNASNVHPALQINNWPACFPLPGQQECPALLQSSLGNPGIVISTADRKYSISYVSVEALDQWVKALGLGYGLLQNKAGNFVEATLGNVEASIDALAAQTPADGRFSLVNAPGQNSYPIVGYGYALVSKQQLNPDIAVVVRAFLKYCLLPNYGNSKSFLDVYHFAPLPPAIVQFSLSQIALIGP